MKFIPPKILKIVYEYGIKCSPKKACGFILSNENIIKALNIQDELNKKNPTIYLINC